MFTPDPKQVLRIFACISFVIPMLVSVRIYFEFYARYPGRVRVTDVIHNVFEQELSDALARAAILLALSCVCSMIWAVALRWVEKNTANRLSILGGVSKQQ